MLFWTFQTIIISIILIFLVHHLISYFKQTLTVPKIKDLVNLPSQKYETMFNVISNSNSNNISQNLNDYLPKTNDVEVKNDMKNELKNFLKKQLNNSNTTEIDNLDFYSSSSKQSFFSPY